MEQNVHYQTPPLKEVCFRLAYVLFKAGGQLSTQRAVDLVGEYFHVSDEVLNQYSKARAPIWGHHVLWARQKLRIEGFLQPVHVSGRGIWRLSASGRDLGKLASAFYDNRETYLPAWADDFLSSVRKRIRGFLRGTGAARPRDIELCRWVDLCYRFEMWSEGIEVFRRVLRDKVPRNLYQVAERQARLCEHKAQEIGSG